MGKRRKGRNIIDPKVAEARFREKVPKMMLKALNSAERMMRIGLDYKRRIARGVSTLDDPPPKTAKEAQGYAALRLKASDVVLELSGARKVQAPIRPKDGDELILLKRKLDVMSKPAMTKWLQSQVDRGEMTTQVAEKLWSGSVHYSGVPVTFKPLPVAEDDVSRYEIPDEDAE